MTRQSAQIDVSNVPLTLAPAPASNSIRLSLFVFVTGQAAQIDAVNVWGVLYALETFSQLVQTSASPSAPPLPTGATIARDVPASAFVIFGLPIHISDKPAYPCTYG